MRLHKSEAAFFLFIAVILAAGVMIFHAYDVLFSIANGLAEPERYSDLAYLSKLLFATGLLLATGLVFGLFFIFPLIRRQVREENKLRAMTETLSARSQKLEYAALTDALTGMQNRRYFDDALKEYLGEFRRIEKPVGLMTRYHDVVARLGGEEFAVVAPNMDVDTLVRFAERIRKAVAGMVIVSGSVRLKVTASVGLAVWDRKENADGLFRRADQQLYQAKKTGRNRVCA
jgi:PleD family two-component response regulator